MNPTLKQLNKLILAFLQENADAANQDELWMDSTNQKQVKNLLSRASRPPKDPNAPKRGKSSYLYFCADNRDQVKKSLGNDAKATDVTRELGVHWNKLKDDKKKEKKLNEYVKMAKADKERYQKEKAAYTPPANLSVQAVKKGPKRAKSAYLYFCSDNRAAVKADLGDGSKATDATRELGVRWNALKASNGTGKYDKLAVKDKKRYFSEKSSTQPSVISEEDELVEEVPKKASTKKAPKKKVKSSASKKATGRNGYQVFCGEHRVEYKANNPGARAQDITKKLSAAWKKLSKEDQSTYKRASSST
jgi:hypothetical protein